MGRSTRRVIIGFMGIRSMTFRRPSFSKSKQAKEKLLPELVPGSSWFNNLRSELPKEIWDKIRKYVYSRAGMRCEICGGRGPKWPVECHEVWEYDEVNKIQRLVRLIALCPACHEVKHIGLAQLNGKLDQAMKQICSVNGIMMNEATEIVEKAHRDWERRSEIAWELDISYLDKLMREI